MAEAIDTREFETAEPPQESASDGAAAPGARRQRFGLGPRLFLAFGVVAGLTVLAGGVAWVTYGGVEAAYRETAQRSAPAMEQSLRLQVGATELAASAPQLAAAADDSERQVLAAALSARVYALDDRLGKLAQLGAAEETVGAVRSQVMRLSEAVETLDKAVARRLELAREFKRRAAEVDAAQGQVDALIAPLLDDASFELMLATELAGDELQDTLSGLIDVQVARMRIGLEATVLVNHMAGLVAQTGALEGPERLVPLAEAFNSDLGHLRDQLDGLARVQGSAELDALYTRLEAIGAEETGLFALMEQGFALVTFSAAGREAMTAADALREEMAALQSGFLERLGPIVDSANFDLVLGSEEVAGRSTAAIGELMDGGVSMMVGLLRLKAEVNVAAGLLHQAGGITDATLLQPLGERFNAAHAAITGELASLPEEIAQGAFGQAVTALLGHGHGEDSLFASQAAELEARKQGRLALAASSAASEQLGLEVASLLLDAEARMASASEAVSGAIETGKLAMGVLAAASVVIAFLIAWLYVGRAILRRLAGLAQSMQTIAAGTLEVEVPTRGSDELADMGRNLAALRDSLAAAETERRDNEAER
ncbi:MAG: HAMP domain-containing protein, partial [Tistlia sp.]